jgi:hypothetical protein
MQTGTPVPVDEQPDTTVLGDVSTVPPADEGEEAPGDAGTVKPADVDTVTPAALATITTADAGTVKPDDVVTVTSADGGEEATHRNKKRRKTNGGYKRRKASRIRDEALRKKTIKKAQGKQW